MTGSVSRERAVSTVTGLWSGHPSNGDSNPGNNKKFVCSPKRPEVCWGPSSVLINGYWRYFPLEQFDLEVNNLARRLRKELYLYSPHVRYGIHTDKSAAIAIPLISPVSD
jgi:hypothetical protein